MYAVIVHFVKVYGCLLILSNGATPHLSILSHVDTWPRSASEKSAIVVLRSTTHRGDSSRAQGPIGGPLSVISVCVSRGASGALSLSLSVGECRFTFGFMAGTWAKF